MNDSVPSGLSLRALVERTDWSATPLGPPDRWSESLRTTVETCLGTRFPVIIFWAPSSSKSTMTPTPRYSVLNTPEH